MVKIFDVSHYDVTLPKWKADLLESGIPTVTFYPYADLNVGGGMTSVYLLAENEEEITEDVREHLIKQCSDYGEENARKVIPPLEKIKSYWRTQQEL